MSLSPLEIAKVRVNIMESMFEQLLTRRQAFEAPILSDCNSNSSGRDMAKGVGTARARYGAIRDNGKLKLAFADPSHVERPWEHARFDI